MLTQLMHTLLFQWHPIFTYTFKPISILHAAPSSTFVHLLMNDGALFQILNLASSVWSRIGYLLGIQTHHLSEIESRHGDPSGALYEVLATWLKTDRNRYEKYERSWKGIHEVLVDTGHHSAAKKLWSELNERDIV